MKNNIPTINLKDLSAGGMHNEHIIATHISTYWVDNKDKVANAHTCTFYQIIYFTKGSGRQQIDFDDYPINQDYLYIIRPNQIHALSLEDNADGYIINFSERQFHQFLSYTIYLKQFSLFRQSATSNRIYMNDYEKSEIIFYCEKIIKELAQKNDLYLYAVSLILMELFLNVNRQKTLSRTEAVYDHKKVILNNFEKLVEEHYLEKRLPSQYADLLFITASHLNFICKTISGKSAGEIIRDKVLLEAKRGLMGVDVCVSDVACRLNFSDTPYFIKFFKKHTGLTPMEYYRAIPDR